MTNATPAPRRRRYRMVWAMVRVVGVTALVTILAFCLALFFGIVGIVLTKMIRGTPGPSLVMAYRNIALPVAVAALVVAFIITLVMEVRHYRRQRAALLMGPGKAA